MSYLLPLFFCLSVSVASAASSLAEVVSRRVASAPTQHPRLMVDVETFAEINANARRDRQAARLRQNVIDSANELLSKPPVERKLEGRRLLSVSREALARIATLAMAYRLEDDRRYLARAAKEMVAVCEFSDWNPSHFLDTAEMTLALAIGYDWLYQDLEPEVRTQVRQAIVRLGIEPSFARKHSWIQGENNWNQVCHGGITGGALAILEDEPDLAVRVIQRAVEGVPFAMEASYAPDGAYPEGPSYWAYGTRYNVILLDCLTSALGTDFGLSQAEGFDVTGTYLNMCAAPAGGWFNYADCGERRSSAPPALHWLANRFGRPEFARLSERQLEANEIPRGFSAVTALLWRETAAIDQSQTLVELPTSKLFGGKKPIWIYCGSWTDPDATYLAVCGGTPRSNHGHMDSGSFVYEAEGVRWSIDLGSQSYYSLERRGVSLWDSRQEGQRWEVFRLNNLTHSTLVFDGGPQQVNGFATLVEEGSGSSQVTVDLTSLYAVPTSKILRQFQVTERQVRITDTLLGLQASTVLRWGMATRAKIELDGNQAVLRQSGKRLVVRAIQPSGAIFKTVDLENPPRSYDVQNPEAKLLALEVDLAPEDRQSVVVTLRPEDN